MRLVLSSFCLLALLLSSAWAGDYSALATISNIYFYRGYSKSGDGPSIRLYADYNHTSGFYAQTWISWVSFEDKGFADRANLEFYPSLGFSYEWDEKWRLDAAFSYYLYDGRLFGTSPDYAEYSALMHFRDLFTVRIDFSDNYYNSGLTALNYAMTGRYPIAANLQASAGLGYNDADRLLEYNNLYWNLGITWFFKYGALDFRYLDAVHTSTLHGSQRLVLPDLSDNFAISFSVGF